MDSPFIKSLGTLNAMQMTSRSHLPNNKEDNTKLKILRMKEAEFNLGQKIKIEEEKRDQSIGPDNKKKLEKLEAKKTKMYRAL